MASRVVEVLYKLKDLFTPTAKKVEKAYSDLGKSAEDAAQKVDKTNAAVGGTLGKLQQRFNVFKTLAKGGAIGTAISQFTNLVRDSATAIIGINRSARNLGLTAQEFLDLRDIAGTTNVQVRELETAFRNINNRLNAFNLGSKAASAQFEKLGIDAEKFSQLDAAGQLERLAQAALDLGGGQEALAQVGRLIGARPGSGLLLLIEKGPTAVREVAQAAKETGEVLNQDVVNAALRIERISEAIKLQWNEITGDIRNALVEGAAGVAENVGLGDTARESEQKRLNNLREVERRQILALADAREKNLNIGLREQQLERTRKSIADIEKEGRARTQATIDAEALATDRQEATEKQTEADSKFADQLGKTSDALDAQTRSVRENLNQQKREFSNARRDQIAIERAFQDLINEVTGEDISVEDVTLGDVFGKLNQALSASERGNLDEAVSLAIEGADYLGLLKEKGTETQGTLGFLAKQLSDVANQAAAARVEAEQGDVLGVEALEQKLAAQSQALDKIGAETGRAYAQTLVNAAQAVLDQNVLQPKVAAPAVQGQGYIEWSGDASSRRTIDGSGVK